MVDGIKADLRFYIPESCRLVRLRKKMGVADEELNERLNTMLATYNLNRERVVDIERVAPLCSLAEAYAFLGDSAQSLEVYALAIQEGQVNPNSRPRADDLSRICLSMALNQVEPSEAVWASLQQMCAALGEPW